MENTSKNYDNIFNEQQTYHRHFANPSLFVVRRFQVVVSPIPNTGYSTMNNNTVRGHACSLYHEEWLWTLPLAGTHYDQSDSEHSNCLSSTQNSDRYVVGKLRIPTR